MKLHESGIRVSHCHRACIAALSKVYLCSSFNLCHYVLFLQYVISQILCIPVCSTIMSMTVSLANAYFAICGKQSRKVFPDPLVQGNRKNWECWALLMNLYIQLFSQFTQKSNWSKLEKITQKNTSWVILVLLWQSLGHQDMPHTTTESCLYFRHQVLRTTNLGLVMP